MIISTCKGYIGYFSIKMNELIIFQSNKKSLKTVQFCTDNRIKTPEIRYNFPLAVRVATESVAFLLSG